MTLPPALQAGIDDLTRGSSPQELATAARRLSETYRAGGPEASRSTRTAGDVRAYLATRAPATYAAAADVFRHVSLARPAWQPASVLDLGAGPGIAAWAALERWPGITSVRLVEAEPEMVRAGTSLAANGPGALRGAGWLNADAAVDVPPADLVIASYLLGELDPRMLATFGLQAWERTTDTLALVEPGTTAGYERVMAARTAVIDAGGATLAPCPHDAACPLPQGDWCHFSARLPRTRVHRVAKDAERGFEDEKFSYAVLCRSPQPRPDARVLRRPDARPGHIVVDLCTPAGIEQRTVSRRDGDAYRRARKVRWGDTI